MPASVSTHPRFCLHAKKDLVVAGYAQPGDSERALFTVSAGSELMIDLVHWVCTKDHEECDYAIYHPRRRDEMVEHARLFSMQRVED